MKATNTTALPRILLTAMLVVAACVLSLVCTSQAHAENIQLKAPTTVSDDITRLDVNKLDADTHEYVIGATMAIINEETGEVVDSWVTGPAMHENDKGLDVNVVYILRELSAPEGYTTVSDVRFIVNETEGTGITVLSSGDDAQLNGSYRLDLFDKKLSAEVVTETTATNVSTTSKTVAPKTGDEAPLVNVAILMLVGIALISLLQLFKNRMDRAEEE